LQASFHILLPKLSYLEVNYKDLPIASLENIRGLKYGVVLFGKTSSSA